VYIATGDKRRDISAKRLPRPPSTFSTSVRVSVGVSTLGNTELIYSFEPNAEVSGAYYIV